MCDDDDYLTSIGLPPSWDEVVDLVRSKDWVFAQVSEPFTHVAALEDPSGFRVSSVGTSDGFEDLDIVLDWYYPLQCLVWQLRPGLAEVCILDEGLRVEPEGDVITKLLVAVDDACRYPIYPLTAVGEPAQVSHFSIGAIAVDFKVWESVDDFMAAQEPISTKGSPAHDMIPDYPDEFHMGPEFVLSPWLFAVYGGKASAMEANAAAQVRAICRNVEVVRNHINGGEWLRVEATCDFPLILALPIDTPIRPQEGSVIDGRFILTGTSSRWA